MNRFRFWDGISAKIADIERMLAGRGKVFSETEVNRAQAAYRGIVPGLVREALEGSRHLRSGPAYL